MTFAGWYKLVLLVWLVLGLPALVIGLGMGGGRLPLPGFDTTAEEAREWLLGMAWRFAPILLAPIGIKVRRYGSSR